MKNRLLLLLGGLLSVHAILAQTPFYILYNSSCMNRLEYRYKGQSSGPSILTYTARPEANQLYMFDIGAEGDRLISNLPKGAMTCRDMDLNDDIVRSINNGRSKAYILRQAQGGYVVSAVASAMQVVRGGSNYIFRGHNFEFALDTTNLNYDVNIATPESRAYIFFNGRNQDDCHPIYTFKREPDEVCTTKTDFDFIPGLGIISERTGMTAAEALENEYRLVSIDGYNVQEYLTSACQGRRPEAQPTPAPAPAAVTYGTTTPPRENVIRNVAELDKEQASAAQQQPAASQAVAPAQYGPSTKLATTLVGPRALIDCPEKPGEGHHIVQPGETLNAIARGYGLKLGMLLAWNNIDDPDMIQPCQKIYITTPPGGLKPAKDKNTGKLVIASKKPAKKSKSKKKSAPAPAQYSTEIAATAPKKQSSSADPQYIYWESKVPQPLAYSAPTQPVAIQYVPQYIYVQPAQVAPQPATYSAVERPATYSTEQPALVARADVRPTIGSAGIVHTVQPGESLYSIAKMYGFTGDRFRKMNGLPENFVLQPGMQLVTTDCSCDASGKPLVETYNYPKVAEQPAQYSTSTNAQPARTMFHPNASQPTTYGTSTTSGGGTFQEFQVTPKGYSNTTAVPVMHSTERNTGRIVEHVVQSGETLGSIASRYSVSVETLADANSLEKTETLIVGMRLMIPR